MIDGKKDMDNHSGFAEQLKDVEMFRFCEQCGRCSSACPITGKNDFNIRRLLRHVELDLVEEIAASEMPWFCAVCGRCEDACPNGIKIIDITRVLRIVGPKERIPENPPCVEACPAGIDVPGYLRYIAEGKMNEACELIMEKAPFPGILGRICTHPCESACKRGEVNEPISICAAKRYAADKSSGDFDRILVIDPETGHKVAVIGAGPAGMTAAFYLRRKGHEVTVFEAREKAGGMMRYGIPRYRLPENVLDQEIDRVLGLGIKIRSRQKLGKDFEIDGLKNDGFEAIFVAVGAQLSKRIDLEGIDSKNVLWGVDFLGAVAEGKSVSIMDDVLVVGGGNVAIDAALTALRLGAKKVTLACLESREEMPANPWEVEMALEEGVEMLYSWGPKKILERNGSVCGVELVRCVSVFDDEGQFCPYFDETQKAVETEQIILAIGQASETEFCKDFCFLDDTEGLPIKSGLIHIDPKTQQTELRGVFSGGDAANGPATVIEAIAAGRRAAASIDKYLGGNGELIDDSLSSSCETADAKKWCEGKRVSGFAENRREDFPTLPVQQRHTGFSEVDLCMDEDPMQREVYRCLQCDLETCMVKP